MHTQRPNANPNPRTKRVLILGSTGSIGTQTIEVIAHCNRQSSTPQFEIVGLASGVNYQAMRTQAEQLGVGDLALCDESATIDQTAMRVRRGDDAARRLVEDTKPDLVVAAIVGVAGLDSVLYALKQGIDVALANKESLVAAGSIVIETARSSGARILPIDSEHAGVWQCLLAIMGTDYTPPTPINTPNNPAIKRITLTASGGPFRNWSLDEINNAAPTDALNHPNWSMGSKVTIDSATLVNKGLELIEAHWLFGVDADQLDAVIHPQSIIHALIECADHSVLAQLGAPDMRCPIQHALCFPNRSPGVSKALNLQSLSRLDFEPIDHARFPAIQLALSAIRAGGTSGAILNASNEIAVRAFLDGHIRFGQITEIVAQTIGSLALVQTNTLADVLQADAHARQHAEQLVGVRTGGRK